MKTLYEYCVNENISAQTIFEICSWLENTAETLRQMEAICKSMQKKDPNTISFERLASASTVDKLCAVGAKLAKLPLDTATRKELRKYVASCIMRLYTDDSKRSVADWNYGDWNYSDLDW